MLRTHVVQIAIAEATKGESALRWTPWGIGCSTGAVRQAGAGEKARNREKRKRR